MPSSRPRPLATPPTAVSLRRWLCAWLALLIGAQSVGSALAVLRAHRHSPSLQSSASSTPVIQWRHGAAVRDVHAQWHAQGLPHDHAVTDRSVVPLGIDTATEAVAQLAATLAPGAESCSPLIDAARHVLADAASWAPSARCIAPPLRPPRA